MYGYNKHPDLMKDVVELLLSAYLHSYENLIGELKAQFKGDPLEFSRFMTDFFEILYSRSPDVAANLIASSGILQDFIQYTNNDGKYPVDLRS